MYILSIPAIFYFFVFALDALEPASLREGGWIFNGPPAGEPWWYFWTLYSTSGASKLLVAQLAVLPCRSFADSF
jgi:hypothetical protein